MSTEEHIVVKTSKGSLRGKKVPSVRRGTYYSFQGIPYAKPPVGPLRFKSPVEADSWTGIRDALKEGPVAPSKDFKTGEYNKNSSEDCLYLNVYTPKVPSSSSEPLKAVLFWIHGGGFCSGSGNTDQYSPDYLVTEDVVIVTCNYRLGPLGFLSLQNSDCPGNNGLKDVILALKWCQNNISAFGGDPKNVTVFGESAGGISIHFLLLSKKTEGLFHKAISQSGQAFIPMACANFPRQCAFKLGELLGCKTSDEKKLLEFLMKASPKDLTLNGPKVLEFVEPNEHFGDLAFLPCVEPETKDSLITKHPKELHKAGEIRRIPYMLGANTLEGLISYKRRKPEYQELKTDKQMECLIPNDWRVQPGSQKAKNIVQKIRQRYFPKGPNELSYIQALSRIYFVNGINLGIEYQSNVSTPSTPTFVYRFTYDGDVFNFKDFLGFKNIKGTCHADELIYLFKENVFKSEIRPGTKDYAVMETITKLWTDFAKTGNPMPGSPKSWPPISKTALPYMEIDETLTLKSDLEKSEYEFWKDLEKMAYADE